MLGLEFSKYGLGFSCDEYHEEGHVASRVQISL